MAQIGEGDLSKDGGMARSGDRSNSARLADAAMALLTCESPDEVFAVAVEFVTLLCPESVVVVNGIDPDTGELITRHVVGLEQSLFSKVASLFGVELIGSRWTLPADDKADLIRGEVNRLPEGVAQLTGGHVPRVAAETAARLAGIHDIYAVGIADGREVLGSIQILTRSEGASVPAGIIESFSRHCYSALSAIRSSSELAATAERNRLVLRNLTEGLALHEVILDADGEPHDYRFLDVNPAFESLTGLVADDIVGRSIREVMPDAWADIMERYRKVAATGAPARFQDHSADLSRDYEVTVYSPQPGQLVSLISDVTERNRAAEADREREAHYRTIVETLPIAVIMSSGEQQDTEYVNPEFVKLFGYSLEDVPSVDEWWPLAYPDEGYREQVKRDWFSRVGHALEATTPMEPLETVVTCRDGSVRNIKWGYAAVADRGFAFALDLTEEARAKEALELSEAKFSTAFHVSPDAVNINRMHDGMYIDVNRGFTEMTGFTKEDVDGKTSADIDIWDDPADRRRLVAGLQADGVVNNLETRFRRKDGSVMVGLMSARLIEVGGEPAILSVTRDVSERRAAEAALLASEARFRSAVQTATDGFWFAGLDGHLLDVNDAYIRMSGYTREELLGMSIADLEVGETPEEIRARTQRLVTQGHDRFESQHRRKDGTVYDVEISLSYEPSDEGRIVVFTHDITERKRAEAEILRMNAELEERVQERTEALAGMNEELTAANEHLLETNSLLEEATKAKSEFLASMSHELRTPLNSIIGFTGVLLQGLAGPVNPEQVLQLNMVSESGRHLLSLIDDILDLSKIESGKTAAQVEEFDVDAVADKALEMIRPLAEAKKIELEFTRHLGTDRLRSDPRIVSQILINLLGNAVKFTDTGRVSLDVGLEDGQMAFTVSDTGRGIRSEDLPRIMESFYQAEPVTEAKSKGTGLGLAISAKLADIVGGSLEVSSEFGVGSRFTLRLPHHSD